MILSHDIEKKINENYADIPRILNLLKKTNVPEVVKERVIRCILYLSERDYDSLETWINKVNTDRRDVYYFAEYDNRNGGKWNFSLTYDKQYEYQFRVRYLV